MTNLEDLSRELDLLRARAAQGSRSARVSLEDLARRVGEPKSSIHAYVSGMRMPPAQVLDRIVIALGASSDEQRDWAEAWYRVGAHRQTVRRAHSDPAVRDAVPHQLPSAVDSFLGREPELRLLDELMSDGSHGTIAAITGTAGVGKTALAVHWAQTRAGWFPDGQLYLDLCGFDPDEPMNLGQALGRLLRALGTPNREIPRELDERASQFRSLLSGRRMLVVLDNARDTEQVRALLPGSPSCTLVTSRDSLAGLVARHGAHRLELDVLPLPAATELLQLLVGAEHRAGPEPTATFAALAEQCARLPLALRIAADVAGDRPHRRVAELVDELASTTQQLDLLEAGDDPRTALRAVFSWSYRQLPVEVARGFRLIGQYPGDDLTPDVLAALLATPLPEAHRVLRVLRQAHLVAETRPGRYTMHTLLRAYARERAMATDSETERDEAPGRPRDHHVRGNGQVDRRAAGARSFALPGTTGVGRCATTRGGSALPTAVPGGPT